MKTLLTALLMLPFLAATGCATIRVTDPPRTATEQFLLSQAISQAIGQLNLDALRDRRIWIDTSFITGTEQFNEQGNIRQRIFTSQEQAFAAAELREKLLIGGARLVQEKKEAEIVVEVRSGAIGTDRLENLIGVPGGVLGGIEGPGGIPLITPELALYKNTRQRGFASIAYVAYRQDTGDYVTSSGPYIGRTLRDDFWLFGAGPRTVGNIPTTEAPR